MTESERADRAYGVFQTIARGYDAANERISLGRQRRWKRAAIDGLRLKNTGRGLDLGCGTGDMLELLAERYPGMELVGLDFSPNMLQVAKERLAGFANVSLEQGDAMHLGYADGSFDCVVSAFALRNMASCERAVGEIARVLKPGRRGLLHGLLRPGMQGAAALVQAVLQAPDAADRRRDKQAQGIRLAVQEHGGLRLGGGACRDAEALGNSGYGEAELHVWSVRMHSWQEVIE